MLLVVLLGITACSLLQGSGDEWRQRFAPLSLAGVSQAFQASGVLTFRQGSHQVTFPLELLVSRERMSVVILSPIGGALASATYAGGQIESTGGAALPPPLQGDALLRALQWALWPTSALEMALTQQGWGLQVSDRERTIASPGQRQIHIRANYPDPLQGEVEFEHLTEQYRWTLQIVHLEALESPVP